MVKHHYELLEQKKLSDNNTSEDTSEIVDTRTFDDIMKRLDELQRQEDEKAEYVYFQFLIFLRVRFFQFFDTRFIINWRPPSLSQLTLY